MRRSVVVFLVVCAAALVTAPGAQAHGRRDVGDHEWTVGWVVEPAFVGVPNAVQLIVAGANGEPAEGLEKDLRVEVKIGDEQTEPLVLRTVFDSPGEYRADLIPTVPGGYTFRFTGETQGEQVDESFTSPRDGFDEVEGASDIAFPKAAPSTTELAERLVGAERTAAKAEDAATLPTVLSVVGVLLGLVALIVAARRRGSVS